MGGAPSREASLPGLRGLGAACSLEEDVAQQISERAARLPTIRESTLQQDGVYEYERDRCAEHIYLEPAVSRRDGVCTCAARMRLVRISSRPRENHATAAGVRCHFRRRWCATNVSPSAFKIPREMRRSTGGEGPPQPSTQLHLWPGKAW